MVGFVHLKQTLHNEYMDISGRTIDQSVRHPKRVPSRSYINLDQ